MRNIILNENCLETIKKIENNNIKVNIILTSTPYNTSRKFKTDMYKSS